MRSVDGAGGERADARERAELDDARRARRARRTARPTRFGPASSSIAWVTSTLPRPANARATARCSAALTWPVARIASWSATRSRISWVGGGEVAVGVGDAQARARDAELRGDAVVEVLPLLSVGSHTILAPSASATSTAAGFMPPTSRSQQMPPNTCEAVDERIERGGEPGARGVVALQDDRACGPRRAACCAASSPVTDRSRCGSGPKCACRSAAPVRSTLIPPFWRRYPDLVGLPPSGSGLDDGEVGGEDDLAVEVGGGERDPLAFGARGTARGPGG